MTYSVVRDLTGVAACARASSGELVPLEDKDFIAWNSALTSPDDLSIHAPALPSLQSQADHRTVQAFKTATKATPAEIANALQALIHLLGM